jgi:hypothetical protein
MFNNIYLVLDILYTGMRGEQHFLKVIGLLALFILISFVFQRVYLFETEVIDVEPDETVTVEVELLEGDYVKWSTSSDGNIRLAVTDDPVFNMLFDQQYYGPEIFDAIEADSDMTYYFHISNDETETIQVVLTLNYNWTGIGLYIIAAQIIALFLFLAFFALLIAGKSEPTGSSKKRPHGSRKKRSHRRR